MQRVPTFSLSHKPFCWSGIGVRSGMDIDPNMPAHRHSFFQVLLITRGSGVHHEIGDRVFSAQRGDIFFISPYTVHRAIVPADSTCHVIYFDARFLRQDFQVSEVVAQQDDLYRAPELLPFVHQSRLDYHLDDEELAQAQSICERMAEASRRRGLFNLMEARALLTLLLMMVCKRYCDGPLIGAELHDIDRRIDPRVRTVLQFLQQNFHKPLVLEDVARQVHLTGPYITHMLKVETGKSFKQLLDELRLEHAKSLLAYSTTPLYEVAIASGFCDQAHFARRFKAYTHVTAGQFRRQRRQQLDA